MAKSLPPLTWFRSFESAARHLNFTAAAQEIGLTQSAVSQQVKSLEHRLRVTLFIRQARGLSLTDDGRKLLPEVSAALAVLAAAADRYDAGPVENLLTVAASVSVAQWVIAPHLKSFTERYPNIQTRFISAIWPDDFHSARADVEIRFGSAKQAGANAELLQPNELVALKSRSLHGDLHTLPLIEAVGTSGGWQAWAEKHGGPLKPALFADTYGMALQLAVHGNGVALVSELLAGHALKNELVERAHPASIASQEGYYLSFSQDKPEAMKFRDWLLELLIP